MHETQGTHYKLKGVARKSRGSLGTQCSQENPKGVESLGTQGSHLKFRGDTGNLRESLRTQGSHLKLKGVTWNSKEALGTQKNHEETKRSH